MATQVWHPIERKLQRLKRTAFAEGAFFGSVVTALICVAYLVATRS